MPPKFSSPEEPTLSGPGELGIGLPVDGIVGFMALVSERDRLRDENILLKGKLDLKDEALKLRDEALKSQAQLAEDRLLASQQKDALEAENLKLKNEIATLKVENQKLKETIALLQEKMATLETKLGDNVTSDELKKIMDDLQSQHKREMESLHERYRSARQEGKEKQQEINSLRVRDLLYFYRGHRTKEYNRRISKDPDFQSWFFRTVDDVVENVAHLWYHRKHSKLKCSYQEVEDLISTGDPDDKPFLNDLLKDLNQSDFDS